MSDLISIIIPIYNSEAKLDACIKSIQKQTFSNYEILLVDDGSTDRSLDKCIEFSEKEKRIKVFHQEHKGQSSARNLAIQNAAGDYISFVDSDDEVDSTYLEVLYGILKASKADVSAVTYSIVPRGEKPSFIRRDKAIRVFDSQTAIGNLLYQKQLDSSQGMKLYRKAILSGITFAEDISVYEDLLFVYHVYKRCNTIAWSNQNLYFYHKESSGQMDRKVTESEDAFRVMDIIKKDIAKEYSNLGSSIDNRIISASFNILKLLACSNRHNTLLEKHCWRNIKDLRCSNFLDSNVRMKNKLGIILSLFGKSFTRFIFKISNY